jgi:hypothetical protein
MNHFPECRILLYNVVCGPCVAAAVESGKGPDNNVEKKSVADPEYRIHEDQPS